MCQTFYVIHNIRRPNPLVRRDLLKVDPPTAVEAQRRAEEDERTHGGRPLGGGGKGKGKGKGKGFRVKGKGKGRG